MFVGRSQPDSTTTLERKGDLGRPSGRRPLGLFPFMPKETLSPTPP